MRPKGTAAELEARRRLTVRLLQEGKSMVEASRLSGAAYSSVKRWKKAWELGGEEALASKPHPGPENRLSEKQRCRLADILCRGARAAGFANELWTLKRIAQVVQKQFGVKYHPGHVWRVLKSMHWSPQRPERRARERDEQAIERWRREAWPRIKKELSRAS
jgi:transposase